MRFYTPLCFSIEAEETRAELGKYFVHFLEDQVNLLLRFSDLVQVDNFQNIHLFTNLSIVKFDSNHSF